MRGRGGAEVWVLEAQTVARRVEPRRPPLLEACEMDVLGGRDDAAAGLGRDRNAVTLFRTVHPGDAGWSEDAAPVARQHFVADLDLLDRLPRPVGHRDQRAFDETLIRIAHSHEVAVGTGEQLQ